MKKFFVTLLLVAVMVCVQAQKLQKDVQTLMDACITMRTAIGNGDIDGLRSANKRFKSVKVSNFDALKPVRPSKFESLDGHFIFEPEFVDSLIALGKGKVYKYADRYTTRGNSCRGPVSARVNMKNVLLKGKSTSIYKMYGKGRIELAFVTEPNGLISVTIYDKKHKVYYKEHEKERQGAAYRVHTFDLPNDGNAELEITIQNLSGEDVSCVVIGN